MTSDVDKKMKRRTRNTADDAELFKIAIMTVHFLKNCEGHYKTELPGRKIVKEVCQCK